jgi:hypothetical protein
VLAGEFRPAPRTRTLTLERRTGDAWRRVARVRTTRQGRYRIALETRGVYRVRYGAVTGAAVRVR